jgi:hypothetical protein
MKQPCINALAMQHIINSARASIQSSENPRVGKGTESEGSRGERKSLIVSFSICQFLLLNQYFGNRLFALCGIHRRELFNSYSIEVSMELLLHKLEFSY